MSFSIVPAFLAVSRLTGEARGVAARELARAAAAPAQTDRVWAACRDIVAATFLSETAHADRLAALVAIKNSEAAAVPESPVAMLSDTPRLSVFLTVFRLHVVPFFRLWWQERAADEPSVFDAPGELVRSLESIGYDATAPKIILRTVARHVRLS